MFNILRARLLKNGSFPDFVLIGAAYCGEDAIEAALSKAPNVNLPIVTDTQYLDRNYDNDGNWYKSFFTNKDKDCITGEFSPEYLYHPEAPQRAKAELSDTKFIVALSNPITRALTEYNDLPRYLKIKASFSQAVEEEMNILGKFPEINMANKPFVHNYGVVARGLYAIQIKRWLKLLPREQFLFILTEDLYAKPDEQLKRLENFLEIPNSNLVLPAREMPDLDGITDEKTIEKLSAYFELHNRALEDLLEVKIPW